MARRKSEGKGRSRGRNDIFFIVVVHIIFARYNVKEALGQIKEKETQGEIQN